jgi:nucleoside-diphosphate-sugar epimerase
METVLVTGASGFVGRQLVGALVSRRRHVRCLVRSTSSVRFLRRTGSELVCGDITRPDSLAPALRGADLVFHAAGLTHALTARQFMHVNASGTWDVAQACAAQSDPPVLVVVSSLAAAGPARSGRTRTEADPPSPVSHYGRSKRAGELAAEAWADKVPVTIVRPGIVFGPRNRELLPMFRSIAHLGIHPIPTFHPPPLSLIHVEDLVELLLRAAERGKRITGRGDNDLPRPPGYYFAADDEHPNYTQLGRMVARIFGRRHLFLWHLAEPLPWLVAGVTELVARFSNQTSLVNIDKMREATAASWASSSQAAREDLGFSPPQTLEERLRETAQWYQQHRWM